MWDNNDELKAFKKNSGGVFVNVIIWYVYYVIRYIVYILCYNIYFDQSAVPLSRLFLIYAEYLE
jgi:hypothetical protein